jgi:hypothetical protein
VTITTKLLAPPPGKAGGPGGWGTAGGGPAAIDDSTEIVWAADHGRQLIPVLRAHSGLIVFVDPLDRTKPKAAFRPDGSRTQPPNTLQHYVRLRMSNPSWWPEVKRLSAIADPGGTLEAMAVFPPEYRSELGDAVRTRMAEMKRTGRVVWLSVALDGSQPAGVAVHDVKLAPAVVDGPRAQRAKRA